MSLSEYELKRLENIENNNKFLAELGLNKIKMEPAAPQKRKASAKASKPSKRQVSEPTRRSLRALGKDPEGKEAELVLSEMQEKEREYQQSRKRIEGKIELPQDIGIGDMIGDMEEKIESIPSKYDEFKNQIPFGTVKLCKEMIYTLAPHPSPTKLLTVAGDKKGNLIFWDVDHTLSNVDQEDFEPVVHTVKPHVSPIYKILYDTNDLKKMYTCSVDGSIRSLDIDKNIIDEVYVHPEESMITFINQTTNEIWFSTDQGEVGMTDKREKPVQLYTVSAKKLNTVHFNPVSTDYFCVSGLDNYVQVFDKRYLKEENESLYSFKHQKSVNSAFWDPNGKHILSTSFDDTVGIWRNVLGESTHLPIMHNNNTGRWVQKFKATWKPSSVESCFVIGNMKRSVDIFDHLGRRMASLDDNLTAIPAVNEFHPQLNIIYSANASGKSSIWK
ncbi:WD repeat-containing protein 76 [Boothiomyces sp. JEL0838]|nr:WD repeat-containing protein 76 [Boothiomyces sp. JEL0838]